MDTNPAIDLGLLVFVVGWLTYFLLSIFSIRDELRRQAAQQTQVADLQRELVQVRQRLIRVEAAHP